MENRNENRNFSTFYCPLSLRLKSKRDCEFPTSNVLRVEATKPSCCCMIPRRIHGDFMYSQKQGWENSTYYKAAYQ